MNYEFRSILSTALRDWPREVDLTKLLGDVDSRYTVDKLGPLADAISEKYIDSPQEVIFRSVHHAIFGALHAAAPFIVGLDPHLLRSDEIRRRFERHLRKGLEVSEIGYSQEDLKHCEKYFEANQSS